MASKRFPDTLKHHGQEDTECDPWIHVVRPTSEPSISPLLEDEIDKFLRFVFSRLALRPKEIGPEATLRVARYLDLLIQALPHTEKSPKEMNKRASLHSLADTAWGLVRSYAHIKPATKGKLQSFLTEHEKTYFASQVFKLGITFLRSAEHEAPKSKSLANPRLVSASMCVSGTGSTYQTDDVSERIFAAHYALRQSKVRNGPKRIAGALLAAGVPGRGNKYKEWADIHVRDRVKSVERRFKPNSRPTPMAAQEALDRYGVQMANKWIYLFRAAKALKS
jgi:hypothetical protein